MVGKEHIKAEKRAKICPLIASPKCGRHFVKFDDFTIYPVLLVARTVNDRRSDPYRKSRLPADYEFSFPSLHGSSLTLKEE